MSDTSAAFVARDQDKVWDFYQTDGLSIFDLAVPRLNHLFQTASRLAPGQRLKTLNIGVGNGWLERRCLQQGWDSWGLDPNPRAADALRAANVQAVTSGIEAMPLDTASFDVVFCSEVFEHLLDPLLAAGMGEIARVLKPGGWLVGSVPCAEELELKRVVCPQCNHVHHAYGHHQSFDRARLVHLLGAAGLEPMQMRVRGFPPFKSRPLKGKLKSAVWWVLGRLGAQAADAKIVFVARRRARAAA